MQNIMRIAWCMLLLVQLFILSEAVSIRRRKHMFGEDPITAPNLSEYRPEVTQVYKRRKPNEQIKDASLQSNDRITNKSPQPANNKSQVSRAAQYYRDMRDARKKGDPKAIQFFEQRNAKRRIWEKRIRDQVKNKISSRTDEEFMQRHRERQAKYRTERKVVGLKGESLYKNEEAYKRRREKQNQSWREWYQRVKEGKAKGDEKATQTLQKMYERKNQDSISRRKRIREGTATTQDRETQKRRDLFVKSYAEKHPDQVRAWKRKSYHKTQAIKKARLEEQLDDNAI